MLSPDTVTGVPTVTVAAPGPSKVALSRLALFHADRAPPVPVELLFQTLSVVFQLPVPPSPAVLPLVSQNSVSALAGAEGAEARAMPRAVASATLQRQKQDLFIQCPR
ncbi:hypothetical protein D3C81_1802520 [compost metagenome]